MDDSGNLNRARTDNTSGLASAVNELVAALAVPAKDTAIWSVDKPKPKKQKRVNREGALRASGSVPGNVPGRSHSEGAQPKGAGISKTQKRNLQRQQRALERKMAVTTVAEPNLNTEEGGNRSSTAGKAHKNAPAGRYSKAKPTTPAAPVDLSTGAAGSVGGRSQGSVKREKRRAAANAKAKVTRDADPTELQERKKRGRADDTISPRGEHKRTCLGKNTRPTTSYADIVGNKLCVAVVRADKQPLSEEQITSVKQYLDSRICDDMESEDCTHIARFRGKPITSDGVLKLWCVDDETLEWLNNAINCLPDTMSMKLAVKKQSELTRKVRAVMVLPDCKRTLEKTRRVLDHQNKWANVNSWTVYAHSTSAEGALVLTLGIPADLVPALVENERRLAHSLGSVYVRFVGDDGALQDKPPADDEPKTTPKATTATMVKPRERTPPKVPQQSSPKPSTSRAMEGVDAEQTPRIDTWRGPRSNDPSESEGEGVSIDGDPAPSS